MSGESESHVLDSVGTTSARAGTGPFWAPIGNTSERRQLGGSPAAIAIKKGSDVTASAAYHSSLSNVPVSGIDRRAVRVLYARGASESAESWMVPDQPTLPAVESTSSNVHFAETPLFVSENPVFAARHPDVQVRRPVHTPWFEVLGPSHGAPPVEHEV